ncbi:hypothetical protein EJB05_13839, partial [Eragrostis curvula]
MGAVRWSSRNRRRKTGSEAIRPQRLRTSAQRRRRLGSSGGKRRNISSTISSISAAGERRGGGGGGDMVLGEIDAAREKCDARGAGLVQSVRVKSPNRPISITDPLKDQDGVSYAQD